MVPVLNMNTARRGIRVVGHVSFIATVTEDLRVKETRCVLSILTMLDVQPRVVHSAMPHMLATEVASTLSTVIWGVLKELVNGRREDVRMGRRIYVLDVARALGLWTALVVLVDARDR